MHILIWLPCWPKVLVFSLPSYKKLCQGNLLMPWANCWVVLWWIPWVEQTHCWVSFCSSTFFGVREWFLSGCFWWRLASHWLTPVGKLFSKLVFQSQHIFGCTFPTQKVHHFSNHFQSFTIFFKHVFCWVSLWVYLTHPSPTDLFRLSTSCWSWMIHWKVTLGQFHLHGAMSEGWWTSHDVLCHVQVPILFWRLDNWETLPETNKQTNKRNQLLQVKSWIMQLTGFSSVIRFLNFSKLPKLR